MATGKGVKLTKARALRLLDWHGGGGTAVYALGSSSYAGHVSTVETANKAIRELAADLGAKPRPGFIALNWTAKEKASLRQRIKDIRVAIRKAR